MYDPSTKTERQWNLPVAFKSLGGTDSDSIIAFDPETEAFVTYRVPNLGFFTRELEAFDGGIWTVYSNDPAKHVEKDPNQEAPVPRVVRFEFPK